MYSQLPIVKKHLLHRSFTRDGHLKREKKYENSKENEKKQLMNHSTDWVPLNLIL